MLPGDAALGRSQRGDVSRGLAGGERLKGVKIGLKSKRPGGEKPLEQLERARTAVGERADRGFLDIPWFCAVWAKSWAYSLIYLGIDIGVPLRPISVDSSPIRAYSGVVRVPAATFGARELTSGIFLYDHAMNHCNIQRMNRYVSIGSSWIMISSWFQWPYSAT